MPSRHADIVARVLVVCHKTLFRPSNPNARNLRLVARGNESFGSVDSGAVFLLVRRHWTPVLIELHVPLEVRM
jgi:hypothetical protein